MKGRVYVVATPIGNLGDMTYRAVKVLGECDVIACEDTRQTRKLLDHYGIDRPLVSYHEHNEASRAADLLDRAEAGEKIAVVSDAGTPLISDPGYRVVEGAVSRGIPVEPIPGACAAVAALSASGLPSEEFHFGGFLPRKSGQRQKLLESLADSSATLIFYEAPHRLVESLNDIAATRRDPVVVVARELTKLHEEFFRGKASEAAAHFSQKEPRGEITLLIGRAAPAEPVSEKTIHVEIAEAQAHGASRMDAIKEVARRHHLPKREVYRLLEESGN